MSEPAGGHQNKLWSTISGVLNYTVCRLCCPAMLLLYAYWLAGWLVVSHYALLPCYVDMLVMHPYAPTTVLISIWR